MSTIGSPPRYSDARVTVRWGALLLLPLVTLLLILSLLLPRPEPALAAGLLGAATIVAVAAFGLLRARPPRVG